MIHEPGGMRKAWWTAAELAEAGLPGLSSSKRKINIRAADERWSAKIDPATGMPLCRPVVGRKGGGFEYHVSLLPPAARMEMAKRGLISPMDSVPEASKPAKPGETASAIAWSWYEHQTAKTKAEAERRLKAIDAVEALKAAGLTASAAVASVAAERAIGASTMWQWMGLVEGVARHDWLPALAPRRAGGGAEAEIDPELWQFLKSDWLRPEKPTFSSCYHRALLIAEQRGLRLPHWRTLWRKIEREVPPAVILMRRDGEDALKRCVPALQRTVAELHALECVNIDGHTADVRVMFPDGVVRRPVIVACQDIYSRKFLAWRIGETESAVQTRLMFADLFRTYGIPAHVVMDNGRAFASKWITGGQLSRFRFKVKADEPLGLLTALGVKTHSTIPFSGQSKPIERGFRDFCDHIARSFEFHGAYTGNSPLAKPANYGDAVVPFDKFVRVFNEGIKQHNARLGRRTEMAKATGASLDQVFAQSYAVAPITKATPEQMRLALLTAEAISPDRETGAITLMGNRYWSTEIAAAHGGKRVIVRFDPDDLTQPVHVYAAAGGRYLGEAPIFERAGFLDAEAAKTQARRRKEVRHAAKRLAEKEQLLEAHELARMMPAYEDEAPLPEPTVIRPVRQRRGAALQIAAVAEPASRASTMTRFVENSQRLRLVE